MSDSEDEVKSKSDDGDQVLTRKSMRFVKTSKASSSTPIIKKEKQEKQERQAPKRNHKKSKKEESQEIDVDNEDENEEEEEYTVEKILDSKITSEGKKYLVKWEGYSEKDNSWEPRENLSNCPALLKKFEASHKKKRGRPSLESMKTKIHIPKKRKDMDSALDMGEGELENGIDMRIGFEYGDVVEHIEGARMEEGRVMILIRWKVC
eukprot:TRINITY_DN8856_c0_g2_i2.p1 TRINITY_DN8856_c0_g2~~TRINITY_DN8856_c0_g2_i2.p1  ORF type:complete len:207 (-),score=45.19 TRINITY_DN8856_c0_g2_i2:60-680(-)